MWSRSLTEVLTTPSLTDLSDRLGHGFADGSLLELALRHRSWCAEHPGAESNERLEFLGDAVIGLAVATELYESYPEFAEGRLHSSRAAVVNSAALAEVAAELDLGDHLLLGRGEDQTGGRAKTSLLEDAFEAVIGAVYVDSGYDTAAEVVLGHLLPHLVEAVAGQGRRDHKSRLLELVARGDRGDLAIEHTVEGPEHEPTFEAIVVLGGDVVGVGRGTTKKNAEQQAAAAALELLAVPAPNESES